MMDDALIVNFLKKILALTKVGRFDWKKSTTVDSIVCFQMSTEDFNIILTGPSDDVDIIISFFDRTIPSIEYDTSDLNDEIHTLLIRLYNYLYSKFPNAEGILTDFINNY